MPLVLGRYEVLRRLAVGGMGEVFLASQSVPGGARPVIVKTLLPDLAAQPGFAEQFLDEARVIATLNHPNVVSLLDVGVWEGIPVIVMEFVRGRTVSQLRRLARERGLTVDPWAAATIVRDAAAGLAHAHHAVDASGQPLHIVHRDVSPQNLMVRADGVTKVLDFGIAQAANRAAARTATGVIKGKIAYMAPERLLGEPVSHPADQFALGVVFWELLADRRLFDAETDPHLVQQVLEAPIPPPSRVNPAAPSALDDLVLRMVERRPESRHADCAEVARALSALLSTQPGGAVEDLMLQLGDDGLGETLPTPFDRPELVLLGAPAATRTAPEQPTVPARPPSRQRRRWPLLAVTGVVLLAAIGALVASRVRDNRRDAEARLRAMFEENAWLADRSVDRFCASASELAPLWPGPPTARTRDAGPFLAKRLTWVDDRTEVWTGSLRLPLPDDAEIRGAATGKAWYDTIRPEVATGADLAWLAELRKFDSWSLMSAGPIPEIDEVVAYDLPLPDFRALERAAKLRLIAGLERGDLDTALAEVGHLQDLIRSTDTLLGEMVATNIAVLSGDAVEVARRRGKAVAPSLTLSAETRLKVRQVQFSAAGFFWPGVSESTMEQVAQCSLAPCAAMVEGAMMHGIAGVFAPNDTARALLRVAEEVPGCDQRLIRRNLDSAPGDPVDLLSHSEMRSAWIRRLYDEP